MYVIKDRESKQIVNISTIKNGVLRPIIEVYSKTRDGIVLIWSAIKDFVSSVFGSGYWMNNEGWDNNEGWKNN